jgi:uncharacterized RDD family membrane protein YckC
MLDLSDDPSGPPPLREGAGFWIRALARVVDTLVHIAVGVATQLATGILVMIGSAVQDVDPGATLERLSVNTLAAFPAGVIGLIALHGLSEGLHGSTLGKRICGLTVISEDGSPATLVGALKRNILYVWDSLFFGLVAARRMGESPLSQRFGDVWGHTQVVRLSSLDAGVRRGWGRFALATTAGLAADGMVLFIELTARLA